MTAEKNDLPYYGPFYDSQGNLVGFGIRSQPYALKKKKEDKKRAKFRGRKSGSLRVDKG